MHPACPWPIRERCVGTGARSDFPFRRTQSPAASCRPTNGPIRHKRAYSTQTGVVDTGPVTPAMTSHRTRADEWSIPHTGGVPCCRAACSTRLTPAGLSAATGCRWPGWWWVRSLGLGSGVTSAPDADILQHTLRCPHSSTRGGRLRVSAPQSVCGGRTASARCALRRKPPPGNRSHGDHQVE